jgi:hypothetical protein
MSNWAGHPSRMTDPLLFQLTTETWALMVMINIEMRII